MRVRLAQSPSVKRIQAPRGWAWQVTATVHGVRRKRQIYEAPLPAGEAERRAREQVALWAAEQANQTLAIRRVQTRLSEDQLRLAERFFEWASQDITCERVRLLATSPLTDEQLYLAQILFRRLPNITDDELLARTMQWQRELQAPRLPLSKAVEQFMASRRVQSGQRATYQGLLAALAEAVGQERSVGDISQADLERFLGRYVNPVTFNKRRGDLAVFFNFLIKREVLKVSPLRFLDPREEPPKDNMPETLPPDSAAALMKDVEDHYPGLATYFALALFGACRPSWRIGEAYELIYKDPEKRGWIFRETAIHIPGSISKTGKPRELPLNDVPPLAEWLKVYPPGALPLPANPERVIQTLRAAHRIPHDGLRHTGISAALASGMEFSRATLIFGVDEPTMKQRYAGLLSRAEANALRGILPMRTAAQARNEHERRAS